jgi:hypothetical protein
MAQKEKGLPKTTRVFTPKAKDFFAVQRRMGEAE